MWATIAAIFADVVKYGPLVVQIIQDGVKVEQTINQTAPNLLPNIATLLEGVFNVKSGSALVTSMLLHMGGEASTISAYGPDGSVIQIPNPDAN